jgi:hypothetical protein
MHHKKSCWLVALLVLFSGVSLAAETQFLADLDALTAVLARPVALVQGKVPVYTLELAPEMGRADLGGLGGFRIVSAGGGRYAVDLKSPVFNLQFVRDADAVWLTVPSKKIAFVGEGPLPAESELDPGTLLASAAAGWPKVNGIMGILQAADAGAVALLLQQFVGFERIVVPARPKAVAFRTKKGVGGGILTVEATDDGQMLERVGWHGGNISASARITLSDKATLPERKFDGLKVVSVPRAELERMVGRALARAAGILYYNHSAPKPSSRVREVGRGRLIVTRGRRTALLQGSPHEIGLQHGRLLAQEMRRCCDSLLYVAGLYYSVEQGEWFPDVIRGAFKRLEPHIPPEYLEEMRGLAEGSGIPLETVQLANVFPALFHCSGFAVFGKASADGKLYHGRVLDYMTELALQREAVVFVVKKSNAIPFANVGYAGFIGSVSGMNASQLAIGEMGGGGEGKWDGTPMPILVRMALERAGTLEDACDIFRNTKRTCEYYYVISDGSGPSAVGVSATPEAIEFVKPGQAHPRLPTPVEDAVILSAGSRYEKLVGRVKAFHGRIQGTVAREIMKRPVAMKSNLHNVLFVPQDLVFYVANARRRDPACDQSYARYDLRELLVELARPPAEKPEPVGLD